MLKPQNGHVATDGSVEIRTELTVSDVVGPASSAFAKKSCFPTDVKFIVEDKDFYANKGVSAS